MLLTDAARRDIALDRALAWKLAAIAGCVNAAGFRAFGLFSANMTGNVSAMSAYLAEGAWHGALALAGIVLGFVAGAGTATLVLEAGRQSGLRAIHALGILAEAGFLALLGLGVLTVSALDSRLILLPGLSFLMGLQNAVSTRISNGRVRTTHLSGMATDIGIGIALLVCAASGRPGTEPPEWVRARLALHGATFLAFAAGGVVGVWLYGWVGLRVLPLAAAALAALALPAIAGSAQGETV